MKIEILWSGGIRQDITDVDPNSNVIELIKKGKIFRYPCVFKNYKGNFYCINFPLALQVEVVEEN